METVAIGALGSGFSTWITAHPTPFWILLGVGILVVLAGFFAPTETSPVDPWANVITLESGNKFEAAPFTNSGNFAGRDNNAPQISTSGSAIFGDSALKEILRSLSSQPQPIESSANADAAISIAIGEIDETDDCTALEVEEEDEDNDED